MFEAEPDPPEHFLAERYCLYTRADNGDLYRCDIHHALWPLQPATAAITRNTMAAAAGFALPDTPPHLRYSQRQEVLVWAPRRVG